MISALSAPPRGWISLPACLVLTAIQASALNPPHLAVAGILAAQSLPAPPQITCGASPALVNPGMTSTITATANDPAGLAYSISFSASAGSLAIHGNTAVLNTSTIKTAGVVQVTCSATDSAGQNASAFIAVQVNDSVGTQALTAFQFADSVGVNVHLHFVDTPYVLDFPQIQQAMVNLGIHHYRNGIDQYAFPIEYQNAESLAKAGIKADWVLDPHMTQGEIGAIETHAPDSIEAYEGPNEDNADAGPKLTQFMTMVKNTVGSNPATASKPIYPPTFTTVQATTNQGSLSALITAGAMHDYYNPRYPETAAYGAQFLNCGGYGTMSFNICVARVVAPGKTILSTETGYPSGTLSDAVIAKYLLRTLFAHLQSGVPRTYLYELIDEATSPGYGLLESNFTPKPAYSAIKNTLSLFRDVRFNAAGKFNLVISGQTQNLCHLLFEKSDGTFLLALWLGVTGSDPIHLANELIIPTQLVDLALWSSHGALDLYSLDEAGNLLKSPAIALAGHVGVNVADRVVLLSIGPATNSLHN